MRQKNIYNYFLQLLLYFADITDRLMITSRFTVMSMDFDGSDVNVIQSTGINSLSDGFNLRGMLYKFYKLCQTISLILEL